MGDSPMGPPRRSVWESSRTPQGFLQGTSTGGAQMENPQGMPEGGSPSGFKRIPQGYLHGEASLWGCV